MSIVKTALIAAAIAAPAFAAHAATPRLTDVQFIAANRCLGLMESKTLGQVDDYALKTRLKAESVGRISAVWDMADQARDDAASAAGHASGYEKAQLISERDTACEALMPPTETTAAPSATHAE
jgi:hypothetical protein